MQQKGVHIPLPIQKLIRNGDLIMKIGLTTHPGHQAQGVLTVRQITPAQEVLTARQIVPAPEVLTEIQEAILLVVAVHQVVPLALQEVAVDLPPVPPQEVAEAAAAAQGIGGNCNIGHVLGPF